MAEGALVLALTGNLMTQLEATDCNLVGITETDMARPWKKIRHVASTNFPTTRQLVNQFST
jgi:hypothetical protein